MNRCIASAKRLLLLAGAMAAFSTAQAQSLAGGQAIIFSAPDNGDTAPATPSLTPQPPAAADFEDGIHAPEFNFKSSSTASPQMPAPVQPAVSPDETDRLKNWAMMTPAEIMGVATPEKILKIPERDAAGQRKNPSVVERYYERQNEAQTNGGGGFLANTPSWGGNFQDNEIAQMDANGFNPSAGVFGNQTQQQPADLFQKPASGNDATSAQKKNSGWSKIFTLPTTPEQNPAEVADMAEFRKLLEPTHSSPATAKSSKLFSPDGGLFSAPQTPPSSVFGQPVNPTAATPGQFNNAIGGFPALPGIAPVSAIVPVPDWKPKPAPWLLQGPQPGVIPRRQF